MTEKNELDFLGKVHRLMRKTQPYFRKYRLFRKYPVHLAPMEALAFVNRLFLPRIDGKTDDIFSYDWDNLIIIDGCRKDTFEEVEGKTDSRISKASNSEGFIRNNFSEGDYSDYVYITGNPFFDENQFKEITGREIDDVFHEVFHTYRTDWDDEKETVLPESIVRDAETAEKLFPDKKKIIHFMQPHIPFLETDLGGEGFYDILEDEINENEWDLAMRGAVEHDDVVEAYRENLEIVMPYTRELGEKLSGKTVLTSDHGNLLGENGMYWHPPYSKVKALREVPIKELDS